MPRTIFQESIKKMSDLFNSFDKQQGIKSDSMTNSRLKFSKEKGSFLQGLITEKFHLYLPNFRDKSNQFDFKEVVKGFEWPTSVLREVYLEIWFEALSLKLANAYQICEQKKSEKQESGSFNTGINFEKMPELLLNQPIY